MRLEYKHNVPECDHDPFFMGGSPNYSPCVDGYVCIAARCQVVHLPELSPWVLGMPARAALREVHMALDLIEDLRIKMQRTAPSTYVDLELFKIHMTLCVRVDDLSGIR